jgi:long-subunit fatty acid transport protein
MLAVLRAAGVIHIIAVDGSEKRLEMAKKLGAKTTINFKESNADTIEKRVALVKKATGIGVDFAYQPWSQVSFLPVWKTTYTEETLKGNFNDRYRVSVGAEYKNALYSTKYYDRIRYRAGLYYEKSYVRVENNSLSEIGASIGLGLPIMRDKSLVNLSAQYFHRKLTPQSKVVENGIIFSIGISFNEFWFFKNKIE